MKKAIIFFLFLITTTIGFNKQLYAQVTRSMVTTNDILTINGTSIRVANLTTLDSLRMPHMVSFELPLVGDDTKRILNFLLASMQGATGPVSGQILTLSFKTINMQFQVIDEKDYKGISVGDIVFSDLNASSKDVARAKVRLQATDMTEQLATNEVVKLTQNGRPALSNSFKLTLGSLLTQKVTSISNIKVTRLGLVFTASVERTDSKDWKDWFNGNNTKDPRQDGTIVWLEAGVSPLFTLPVQGVEIMSVSEFDSMGENTLVSSFAIHCRGFQPIK